MSKSGKASRCSSALVDRSKLLPSICGAERADLATKLLDNEQVISKEIICILEGEEEISGRRKEILHKRWDENVYQPIQDQINRKLNAEYDSFLERKINIYDQYLNVSIIYNLKKRINFRKFRLLTKNRYAIVRITCFWMLFHQSTTL